MYDTVSLINFHSNTLSTEEGVELIAEMLAELGVDNLDPPFSKLAKKYIQQEIIDEEGNINYIKLAALKEE